MIDRDAMRKTLADRLQRAMRAREAADGRKLRQEDVAAGAGLSRSHVANAMGGRTGVSLEAVAALAQYYEISVDYLIGLSSAPLRTTDDIAKNEDERALLDAWRSITDDDRSSLRVALRNAAIVSKSNAA